MRTILKDAEYNSHVGHGLPTHVKVRLLQSVRWEWSFKFYVFFSSFSTVLFIFLLLF